jgi:MFS superfamily sulfate permease-like transporter
LTEYFFERLPFCKWIVKYDKKDLVKDILAGLTIGIVHIPQGMAYSMMAGLPAVSIFFSILFLANKTDLKLIQFQLRFMDCMFHFFLF